MHGWLPWVMSLLGPAVWRVAGRVAGRRPGDTLKTVLRTRPSLWLAAGAVPTVLVIHAVLQSRAELWWALPGLVERHWLDGIWLVITVCCAWLFGTAAAVARAEGHPERRRIAPAGLLLFAALLLPAVWYTRPVGPELKDARSPEGIILQTSAVTCAAASAANLLRRAGREATERSVAEAWDTTVFGATAGDIVDGFARLGVSCGKRMATLDELKPGAAILLVDHDLAGPESHAVAYMGVTPAGREIWDPLAGRVIYGEPTLRHIWHGRAVDCPSLIEAE